MNTELWDRVQATDPKHTKQFNRGGGFKGTAVNATYIAKRLTEEFGPCGSGWGMRIDEEKYVPGHSLSERGDSVIIHVLRASLWYVVDGTKHEVTQYGQTTFVGQNKNGVFTDEEAPKKSLTDAMTKAASLLGFSADLHLGLFDDNKYVSEVRAQFAEVDPKFKAAVLDALDSDEPFAMTAAFHKRTPEEQEVLFNKTVHLNADQKKQVKAKQQADLKNAKGYATAIKKHTEANDEGGIRECWDELNHAGKILTWAQLGQKEHDTISVLYPRKAAA